MKMKSLQELESRPGELKVARIRIGSLPDSTEIDIPVLVGEGKEPGPTLLLTALIHGIEIGGYDVINRLMNEELDFTRMKGKVIAVPVVNPFALGVANRFTPQDSADLNRVFPGNAKGTLSQRIANLVAEWLVTEADYVIDYHSCNPPSCVFTIIDEDGTEEVRAKSLGMAEAFGAITVAPSGKLPGTFSGYLSSIGKPVITPELVFSRRFDPQSSDAGVTGTINVMKHLGMLDGNPEPLKETPPFTEPMLYTSVFADTGGFVYLQKKICDSVKEGEVFATVHDSFGQQISEMLAPVEGVVIAFPMAGNQAVTTGDKIAYFASRR
ncbi:succinylglutamate desuccinylase/aspartoacylase family protein [Fictibacillus sp. NRS-1165]|uniref:succinylglutamate desuccinylase/aspartoacylase family protein n=1 Tax=Fictibacillus sp. NRS-1165 TaxID=3144463 RepID=UPI003D251326